MTRRFGRATTAWRKLGRCLIAAGVAGLAVTESSAGPVVFVDYIRATKAQVFQTDYVPNANTKLVFDLKMEGDAYQNTGCRALFSVPDEGFNFQANFGGEATEGSTVYSWPWKMYGQDGYKAVESMKFQEAVIKGRNTFSFGLGRCDWGDDGLKIHANPTAAEHVFQNPLFVLGTDASTPFNGWDVVLYGFKIYEGDEVVRDYVPAFKDGVVGLFETKGQTFRGSTTETGFKCSDAFGAAFANVGMNEADIVLKPVELLSFPATVRFVSGLKPDLSDGVEAELGTLTTAEADTFPVQFARGAKTYCRFVAEDAVGGIWTSSVREIPAPDTFDSLSYAADGLVAQWDGVENAGRGTHADALTGWTDLVGTSGLTLPGWMSVTEKGFLSAGTLTDKTDCPVVESIPGLTGDDVTVEGAARFVKWTDTKDYYNIQTIVNAPCGLIGYRANVNNGFVVYLPPSGNDVTKEQLYDSQPAGVSRTECQTLAIRVTLNSTTAKNGLDISGAPAPLSPEVKYNIALPSVWKFFSNPRSDLEIHAIRVYNRRLTAREVAWNALVDRVRFAGECDVTEAATLWVEYDGDGAACREGVRYWPIPEETAGCATERFVQDANGYTSTCLGWTLYVETGDGVWEVEDSGTGCSMSYSYDNRRRRLVWHTARSRELPGEYVRLECLESHGQQMIDTGYSPNYQTVLRLDLSYQGTFNSSNPGRKIYGTKTSAEGLLFSCNVDDPGSGLVFWTRYGKDSVKQIKTIDKDVRESRNYLFVSMTSSRAEYADGKGYYCGLQTRTAAQTQPETIRLFGGGATSDIPFDAYPTMRLYGSYIKDDTTLRHEFIPVRSLETGARGLYDYVTGEFRTNMVENAADFTGAADAGILVEGEPARIGEPTIPYGWSQLEEGAVFELAEPNVVKDGRKYMRVKSIARYTFDEETHSWTPAGRTHGRKVTATYDGVPTKYVLEWIPNGLCVIVR